MNCNLPIKTEILGTYYVLRNSFSEFKSQFGWLAGHDDLFLI